MECRICNQPIRFVRGHHPGRKRLSTLAVHESEVPAVIEQTGGELVRPHPGAQRRLRLELEETHRNRTAADNQQMTAAAETWTQPASATDERQPMSVSSAAEEGRVAVSSATHEQSHDEEESAAEQPESTEAYHRVSG
jgi:hypothetical protein